MERLGSCPRVSTLQEVQAAQRYPDSCDEAVSLFATPTVADQCRILTGFPSSLRLVLVAKTYHGDTALTPWLAVAQARLATSSWRISPTDSTQVVRT